MSADHGAYNIKCITEIQRQQCFNYLKVPQQHDIYPTNKKPSTMYKVTVLAANTSFHLNDNVTNPNV